MRTSKNQHIEKAIKGNALGDYLFITYNSNKNYCAGPELGGEFYKVGECFSVGSDPAGNSYGYFKATCYTDTGKITGETYADSTCTGPVVGTSKTLRNGECISHFLAYCMKEEEFRSFMPTVRNEVLDLQYAADQQMAAVNSDIFAATYASYYPLWKGWNQVFNLNEDEQMECLKGLLPTAQTCVDTRNARSYSIVATGLDSAKLNLYSKYGGAGEVVQTIDFQEPVTQDSVGQWVTVRYLVNRWANKIDA
ncbi:hypothetical protein EON65_35835 [archaeon]|nr:MAG: hypothetical protein EON65_35835 [archaeon]